MPLFVTEDNASFLIVITFLVNGSFQDFAKIIALGNKNQTVIFYHISKNCSFLLFKQS